MTTDYIQHLFGIEDKVELEAIVTTAREKMQPVPFSYDFSRNEFQSYLIGYLLASGYEIKKE